MTRLPFWRLPACSFHDLLHTFTQQDVELDKLCMDVAVYNARVMGAAHSENVVELACRTALAYRGVAHVTMPVDVQDQVITQDERTRRNLPHHVSDEMGRQHSLPSEARLGLAGEILNGAKKPAILAGQGALKAGKQLAEIDERLGAPIAKALLGKAALADDSPYARGGIGVLGTRPSQEALEECDALLIVGSSFPYIEFYPEPGRARIVQIDHDPKRIGLRAPVECPLVGAAAVLEALLAKVVMHDDRSFLERARKRMKAWNELLEERWTRTGSPMKPQVVARELNKLLTNDAIVATDSSRRGGQVNG